MKKLITSLLIVAGAAQAGVFATLRNNAGGMMVLLDEKCSSGTGSIIYSMARDLPTQWGCWVYDGYMVHVRWADGEIRSYPGSAWTVNSQGKSL